MPRPTLNNIRNAPDYATTYQWNFEIIVSPAGVSVPANLNFQILTTNLPFTTNEIIEVQVRGHQVNQPGIQKYGGTIDWTAVESVDNTIVDMLEQWKDGQWQPDTGSHLPREASKGVIRLELLNRQDVVRKYYHIYGCILENFNPGDLDGSASDTQKPSGAFRYDYYVYG